MRDRDLPPLSPELRSLIEAEAGAPTSGPEDVAATRDRLLRSIGVAGGAGIEPTAPGNAAGTFAVAGSALKTLAVAAAMAALGGGAYLLSRDDGRATREAAHTASSNDTEQPAARAEPLAERASLPAPDAPISVVTTDEPEHAAPAPKRRRHNAAAPPETDETPPPDEESLIAAGLAAVSAGDFATALDLAEQHRALYPDGAMQQEREILQILALRQLGRQQEAAEREAAFRRKYPASVHQLDQWETVDD